MKTKIFLAAVSHVKTPIVGKIKPHYLLESFMDLRGNTKKKDEYIQWCLSADEFLLDSGAFSFMNKAKKTESWTDEQLQKYIDDYIAFINKWDIKYFFEMDLDSVIGYDRVKEIRKYIEENTGKKTIPVWHITRGIDEFHEMCKNYKYVAIGGIASKEIKKKQHNILFELAEVAHQYGCKIHGLGYLPLQILNDGKCPFDTVDGTSWQGHMRKKNFILNNNKLEKVDDTRYWKEICYDCFNTWTKFSYIAE